MTCISQNIKYLPHDFNTKFYAVQSYRNRNRAEYVCRKYHIPNASLSRWNRKYHGTKESLVDKSHRPLTPHPNAHTELGKKWKIDVKFVPNECKCSNLPNNLWFYQWTCIDEASRKRFIYHYTEHTPANTVAFVYRCFLFYGYKPEEIQTDNGTEFTWNQEKIKVIHPFNKLCIEENIYHHKIKPRTPRHNGKVERSHRNDNERFYNTLKFYSLEDLRYQAKLYLKRSNYIPMAVLNYRTPKEKRVYLEKKN